MTDRCKVKVKVAPGPVCCSVFKDPCPNRTEYFHFDLTEVFFRFFFFFLGHTLFNGFHIHLVRQICEKLMAC